jgi:hypothetical protein
VQNNAALPEKDGLKELIEKNRENNWPDVEHKDKLLASEFSIAGSLKDAAAVAGVKPATASRRLRNPLVAAYLDDILAEIRKDSILTRPFIELQMLETLEQANGEVDIHMVDREGNSFTGRKTDLQAKIAVLKEMRGLAGLDKGGGSPDGSGVHVHFDLRNFGVREEKEVKGQVIDASD